MFNVNMEQIQAIMEAAREPRRRDRAGIRGARTRTTASSGI
jgi:hypothetical protein